MSILTTIYPAMPRDRLAGKSRLSVSFEIFPPKTEGMETQLQGAVARLAPLKPSFFSVTYGAGGSTAAATRAWVQRLQAEHQIPTAAHLTCVNATRAEIQALAEEYWTAGIRRIVALRGDPPGQMGGSYSAGPDGFKDAAELVAALKAVAPFDISVAAYPESHPEAASPQACLDHLKRKMDAGADRAITQFFFDPAVFLRFRDRAVRAGIMKPIVPGILPVSNFTKTCQIAAACRAAIPTWLLDQFQGLEQDAETRAAVAIAIAEEQVRILMANGVQSVHFYTLNRAELTLGICHLLGIRAEAPTALPVTAVA